MSNQRDTPTLIFPTGDYSSISEVEHSDIVDTLDVFPTTPQIICEWLFNAETVVFRVVTKNSGGTVTDDVTTNFIRPFTPPPPFVLGSAIYNDLDFGDVLGMLPTADNSFVADNVIFLAVFPAYFIRRGDWFTTLPRDITDHSLTDSLHSYKQENGFGDTFEVTKTITSKFY
jgi:hypothetical protein